MSSSRRSSAKIANDQPVEAQRMSFVALPRVGWSRMQIGIAAGAFGAIFAAALTAILFSLPHKSDVTPVMASALPAPVTIQPVVTKSALVPKEQPYDISLDASALTPPDETAQIADALPVNVVMPEGHGQRSLPPVMNVAIDGQGVVPAPMRGSSAEHAADQAKLARRAMQEGRMQEAIMYQSRAVEDAPDNGMLRLALAIMYDREGDRQQAVDHYAQVLRLFDARHEAMPLNFSAEPVRRRLAYLQDRVNDLQ